MAGNPATSTMLPKVWDRILMLMADGISLRKVCEMDGMPSRETVRHWLGADESGELVGQYRRAREWQGETLAWDALDIVDAADVTQPAAVNKAKAQMDARKWLASKVAPKVYGDRIDITGAVTVGHLDVGTLLSLQANAARASLPIQASAEVESERASEPQLTDVVDAGTSEGAAGTREPDPNDVLEE